MCLVQLSNPSRPVACESLHAAQPTMRVALDMEFRLLASASERERSESNRYIQCHCASAEIRRFRPIASPGLWAPGQVMGYALGFFGLTLEAVVVEVQTTLRRVTASGWKVET